MSDLVSATLARVEEPIDVSKDGAVSVQLPDLQVGRLTNNRPKHPSRFYAFLCQWLSHCMTEWLRCNRRRAVGMVEKFVRRTLEVSVRRERLLDVPTINIFSYSQHTPGIVQCYLEPLVFLLRFPGRVERVQALRRS